MTTSDGIVYQHDLPDDASTLVSLYDSVGWSVYTADPEALMRALRNSSFVVTAHAGADLVGLARVLCDDVSIMYLQDILVRPAFQRKGIGRQLLRRCLDRYAHVRQKVLLTDDRPAQHAFYTALGYRDVAGLTKHPLHAFVRIEGVDLE